MSSFLSLSLLALSVASGSYATPLSTSPLVDSVNGGRFGVAPLVAGYHPHGSVNNSYIVTFKDGVHPELVSNHMNFLSLAMESDSLQGESAELTHVYDSVVRGYAGKFSEDLVQQIRAMPEVELVEQDQIMKVSESITQIGAPWGLARISHRKRLGFGTFNKYVYEEEGGEGVDVYVIDTGVNIDHVELEGRASWGKTIPLNDQDIDGNGHGSHCAGTIASRAYGVAKGAHVIAVKVLGTNGSGTMSDVIAGVEYAAESAQAKAAAAKAEVKATGKTKHKGSVANMSLGGGASPSLDRIVNAAVKQGLHFAVAAGNDNRDACKFSPAAAELAVTVGASTLSDDRAYFSNWGTCVDIFAPGLNIKSIWTGSPTAINVISGTSMASPHTAGALAYLLSIYPHATFDPEIAEMFDLPAPSKMVVEGVDVYAFVHSALPAWIGHFLPSPSLVAMELDTAAPIPAITPAQLKKALLKLATPNVLEDVGKGSPNLLLFNNATA